MKSISFMQCVLTLCVVFSIVDESRGQNTFPSSGNVGIGTTSPSSPLEVVGDTKIGRYVMIKDFDNATWSAGLIGSTIISRDYTTMFWNGGVTIGQFNTNTVPSLFRATGTLITTGTTALAVYSGNVGIGTPSPAQKLEVNGVVKATGGILFPDGNIQTVAYRGGVGDGGTCLWALGSGGINYNGGNVGIGTLNPAQKLEVNGVVKATGGILFPDGNIQSVAYRGGVGDGGTCQWALKNGNIYNNNSGKVGIGTDSPSRTLEVVGDNIFESITENGGLRMKPYSLNATSQVIDLYENSNVNNSGYALFGIANTTWGAPIQSVAFISTRNGTAATKDMMFWASDEAGTGKGAPAMTIQANTQRVGIGTTSPSQKLDVAGAIAVSGTSVIDQDRNIVNARDGTFNGNVGIGASPSSAYKLNVNGPVLADSCIQVSGTYGFVVGELPRNRRLAFSSGGFSFLNGNDGPANLNAGGISISSAYNGPFPTRGIYVEGNVGIGKDPGYRLDVAGTIRCAGLIFPDSTVQTTAGGGAGGWTTSSTNDIHSTNTGYVGIGRIPTQKLDVAGAIGIFGTAVIDGSRNLNAYGGTFSGNVSVTGNVIVGNRPSTSYKLDVTGNIRANEVVVNTDGSDFVFEESYKLMELTALAKYVQENKHLPDISSANEMQKGGVGVGEMQTKLLQKIEELTLYVIQQEKKIEEQNKRIEKLEEENASLKSEE